MSSVASRPGQPAAAGNIGSEWAISDAGAASRRNGWIEALRILAAFAIVWYHAKAPGNEIAYAGLTAFLIIGVFFEMRRDPERALEIGLLSRRILMPWVFGLVGFGLFNLFKSKPLLLPAGSTLESILYGTNGHLWYLPFIFAVQLVLRLLLKSPLRPAVAPLLAVLLVADLATVPWWRPATIAAGAPVAQYAQALAPVLFAAVLARAVSAGLWRAVAVAFVLAMVWLGTQPFPELGIPYAIGAAVVALAIILGNRIPLQGRAIASWSELMFGVYLIHPVFLTFLHPLTRVSALLGVATAFLLSLGVAWFLRRFCGNFGRMSIGLDRS